MDGSYHQFVNNKKQNHFINAETHRPDFVHSETKKRNEKTKKPSKKKTTDERLKALQKDIERQRALNKLPGIYKPSVKGGLGWKDEAIRNTRHLERSDSDESVTSDSESDKKPSGKGGLGWKVDAMMKNTSDSDSDESVTSDSESDLTENLGEMTQKQMTEKLEELQQRIKHENNSKLKAVYSRKIAALELEKKKEMCPITGYGYLHLNKYTPRKTCKAQNTCKVTTKNCLNYNRKGNAKLMCGEKLLVELVDEPWEHIPLDCDNKITKKSKLKDRKKYVNKNPIVKLITEGPRYLQYQTHSEKSYVFSVFDGSGKQDAASIPKEWVNVSKPKFMNKPPICPLQQFQLIDVDYEQDGIWIGRYLEYPEKDDGWNIFVSHSTEKDNTGNIMQLIIEGTDVPRYEFYPYGEDKQNSNECQELNKILKKKNFHEIGTNGSKWKHHDQPFINQGDVLLINNGHAIGNKIILDLVYVIDDNIDEYGEPYHRVRYVYIDEDGKKIPPPDRSSKKVKEEYCDLYDSANDSNDDDYNDSELEDKMNISEELDVWFDEYKIKGHYSELYPNSTPPLYGTKKDEVSSADDDDGDDSDVEYKQGVTYDGLKPGPWKKEFLAQKKGKGKNGKNSDYDSSSSKDEEDSSSSEDDEEDIELSSDEE